MMKNMIWSRKFTKDRLSLFSPFPIAASLISLLIGVILGLYGGSYDLAIAGAMMLLCAIVLRLDELAAFLVVAISLYVDWYLYARVVSLLVVLVLLVIFFLARSPKFPWVSPRALWIWFLLLLLAIAPAMRGVIFNQSVDYYLNIIFGALIIFWLGTLIARDTASVRRLLQLLAFLGTLLAIVTLIQALTGTLLFASSRYDQFLTQVQGFQLDGSNAHRVGSFFIDPNWNGTFFAMMIFLPAGLFFESVSFSGKILYLAEILLMFLALLFIFSNGAWVGTFAGAIVFVVLVGRMRYRVQITLLFLMVAAVVLILFPAQVGLELQHAAGPTELSSRIGAWQTALQVIHAFPLTGIGFGYYSYLQRAEPYRVLAQYIPLAQPHDAYLELAAMAGIPVLAVFVAILLLTLGWALRNWALANRQTRALFAGGIAAIMALSINSISINGWTLPPLAATGWLILGAVSSPLIIQARNSPMPQAPERETRYK